MTLNCRGSIDQRLHHQLPWSFIQGLQTEARSYLHRKSKISSSAPFPWTILLASYLKVSRLRTCPDLEERFWHNVNSCNNGRPDNKTENTFLLQPSGPADGDDEKNFASLGGSVRPRTRCNRACASTETPSLTSKMRLINVVFLWNTFRD